jgi:hypothetical protein
MYEKGELIHADPKKAIYYYDLAIKQNDPISQYRLGLMYESGTGVKKNLGKAFALYNKAANQDFVKAQFSLGLLYRDGRGTKKSIIHAYKWFDIASKRWKHANAMAAEKKIEKEMSIAQLEEAKLLVENWLNDMKGNNPMGSPFVEPSGRP